MTKNRGCIASSTFMAGRIVDDYPSRWDVYYATIAEAQEAADKRQPEGPAFVSRGDNVVRVRHHGQWIRVAGVKVYNFKEGA